MGRKDYTERQENRRERLEDRAARARAESDAAYAEADRIGKGIPMGQPILVGHHSERGHRADLRRIERNMRKSVEQDAKAKALERRASRVGKGGVSSDDPDAVTKLRGKLADLDKRHEKRKEINAAWRRVGRPAPDDREKWEEIAEATGLDEHALGVLRTKCAQHWYMHKQPFPAYVQKNTNAELRRLRERIHELERLDDAPEVQQEFDACELVEDPDDNRVRLIFEGKPEEAVRTILKRNGFRWAPSIGAWQRQLNDAGRHAAKRVIAELSK